MKIELTKFELMYIRSLIKENIKDCIEPPNNNELKELLASKIESWDLQYCYNVDNYLPESDDDLELLIIDLLKKF